MRTVRTAPAAGSAPAGTHADPGTPAPYPHDDDSGQPRCSVCASMITVVRRCRDRRVRRSHDGSGSIAKTVTVTGGDAEAYLVIPAVLVVPSVVGAVNWLLVTVVCRLRRG